MDRKTSVSQGAADNEPPASDASEWIDAREAARLLEYSNHNSVRNAAWKGAFGERGVGWRRRRRQLEYRRAAVEAYRDRDQEPAAAGVAS